MQQPLRDVLDDAGVTDVVREYLVARRIVSLGTFAYIATTAEEFEEKITNRLAAGHIVSSVEYTIGEDPDVTRAALTFAWGKARAATLASTPSQQSGCRPA
jgi:hypothetical protein